MVNVFAHFSLPQISTVARRTALAALAVGTVALVALALLGHPLVGLGVCLGMTLAIGNFRLISAATAKASSTGREDNRRPLAMNTLGRLGVISVIALGLVFVSRPLGFGTLVGLAVFQFLLLANVVLAMLREPAATAAPAAAADGPVDDEVAP
ncbi:MAG TPA: hypothetical protein VMV14_01910 [Acidimicrobiales bacterium]|nr:hypothetical protein [Acidimicrobiales bacterium]